MSDADRVVGGSAANMKSSNYGLHVVQSLNKLRLSDQLCDFTISAQGRSFTVHKLVLAATSDYFSAMLFGPMRESKENCVELKGLTANALDYIVRFIYSGEIRLDFDNLVEILYAGSHLQISGVLEMCSDYLICLLDFSNAHDLLPIADTYSLSRVIEHYRARVLAEFETFARCNALLTLPADELCEYLGSDALCVQAEALLYDVVACWVAHDVDSRLAAAPRLLDRLRYGLMPAAALHALGAHWLTGRLPPAWSGLNAGLRYHEEASRGHPDVKDAHVRATKLSLVLVHQGSSYQPFEVTALDDSDGRFYRLATDTNGSRDCRVAAVHNFVYVCRVVDCGGGSLMNALVRFDPRHLSLQALTPCRRLRIDPALATADGQLYLCGGADADLTPLAVAEQYDVATNTWHDLPPMPYAVHSLSAHVHTTGELYVSGGVCMGEPTAGVHRYDARGTRRWLECASMQCARRLHEMAACGGRIYVLGGMGRVGGPHSPQIPVEAYDVAADQWTALASTLAGRSVGHFVAHADTVLSLGREHHDATEEDVLRYDADTDTWQPYAKTPRRMSLASAAGVLLNIDFHNEVISRHVISPPR